MITGDLRSAGAALLDVAALVRSLIGPLTELQILRHDHRGFVASGAAGTGRGHHSASTGPQRSRRRPEPACSPSPAVSRSPCRIRARPVRPR